MEIWRQGRNRRKGVFYEDQSRVACREIHDQTSAVVKGGGKPNLNVGRGLGRRRKEREKQEKPKMIAKTWI